MSWQAPLTRAVSGLDFPASYIIGAVNKLADVH